MTTAGGRVAFNPGVWEGSEQLPGHLAVVVTEDDVPVAGPAAAVLHVPESGDADVELRFDAIAGSMWVVIAVSVAIVFAPTFA